MLTRARAVRPPQVNDALKEEMKVIHALSIKKAAPPATEQPAAVGAAPP